MENPDLFQQLCQPAPFQPLEKLSSVGLNLQQPQEGCCGSLGSDRSSAVFGKSSTDREREGVHKPCTIPGVQGAALKTVTILKCDVVSCPGAVLLIPRLCSQNIVHSQNVPGCFHVMC